jgi:hypothetical protein
MLHLPRGVGSLHRERVDADEDALVATTALVRNKQS